MKRSTSQACDCNTCHFGDMWGVEVEEEECEKKLEEVVEEDFYGDVEVELVEEDEDEDYVVEECSRCGEEIQGDGGMWGWCWECKEEGERLADELEDRECTICGRRGEGYTCYECRIHEVNDVYDDDEDVG